MAVAVPFAVEAEDVAAFAVDRAACVRRPAPRPPEMRAVERAGLAGAVRRVATVHPTPPLAYRTRWSGSSRAHAIDASVGACAQRIWPAPRYGCGLTVGSSSGEALPAEVAVVDVGVPAGPRHDQVGHELADGRGDLVAVTGEAGAEPQAVHRAGRDHRVVVGGDVVTAGVGRRQATALVEAGEAVLELGDGHRQLVVARPARGSRRGRPTRGRSGRCRQQERPGLPRCRTYCSDTRSERHGGGPGRRPGSTRRICARWARDRQVDADGLASGDRPGAGGQRRRGRRRRGSPSARRTPIARSPRTSMATTAALLADAGRHGDGRRAAKACAVWCPSP